jgi:CPA1 family monovalent cation:H+ antiporter
MAVMIAAIVVKFSLKEVEDTVAFAIAETWEWLGLFLTNVLFVIMGLVITVAMFKEQWLAMVVAIIAVLIARVIAVKVSCGISSLLGKPVSSNWQILLMWGGLRGAVAIALVLSLPTSLPYWWTIQSMVFGVVVFSLLVQGTTNKMLIGKLAKAS